MSAPPEYRVSVRFVHQSAGESLWKWVVYENESRCASGTVWWLVPFAKKVALGRAKRVAKKLAGSAEETLTFNSTNLSKLEKRTAELERLLDIEGSPG